MTHDQKNAKKTNPKRSKNEQKSKKKQPKTNQNERKQAKFHPKNIPQKTQTLFQPLFRLFSPPFFTLSVFYYKGCEVFKEPTIYQGLINDSQQFINTGNKSSFVHQRQLSLKLGPKSSPDDIAKATVINILGGMFTSRINMNLREDKHWTYGAHIRVVGTAGQRLMFASGRVKSDKTDESSAEVLKEYREIVTDRPPSEEKLRKMQNNETIGRRRRKRKFLCPNGLYRLSLEIWRRLNRLSGSLILPGFR